MPIIIQATVEASATTTKGVTCEHCGKAFSYRMRVKVTGRPQGLSMTLPSKLETARKDARAQLAEGLAKGIGAVWCPGCGKYQRDMIPIARDERVKRFYLVPLAILVAMFPYAILVGPYDTLDRGSIVSVAIENLIENFSWWDESGILWFVLPALLVAVAIKAGSYLYDPNADAASRVGILGPGVGLPVVIV